MADKPGTPLLLKQLKLELERSTTTSAHHREALLKHVVRKGLQYMGAESAQRYQALLLYLAHATDEAPAEWYEDDWYRMDVEELMGNYLSPVEAWDADDDRLFAILRYFSKQVQMDWRRYLKANILRKPKADQFGSMCAKLGHLYQPAELLQRLLAHHTGVDTKGGVLLTGDDTLTSLGRYVLTQQPEDILPLVAEERTVWYYGRLLAFHAPEVLAQVMPEIIRLLKAHDAQKGVLPGARYFIATLREVDGKRYADAIAELEKGATRLDQRLEVLVGKPASEVTDADVENGLKLLAEAVQAMKGKDSDEKGPTVDGYRHHELVKALKLEGFEYPVAYAASMWLMQNGGPETMEVLEAYPLPYFSSTRWEWLERLHEMRGAAAVPVLVREIGYEAPDKVNNWTALSQPDYVAGLLGILVNYPAEAWLEDTWAALVRLDEVKVLKPAARKLSMVAESLELAQQERVSGNGTARLLAFLTLSFSRTADVAALTALVAAEKVSALKKQMQKQLDLLVVPASVSAPMPLKDSQRWRFDVYAQASLAEVVAEMEKAKAQFVAPITKLTVAYWEGGYRLMVVEVEMADAPAPVLLSVGAVDGNFPAHIDDAGSDKVLKALCKRLDVKGELVEWGSSYRSIPDTAFFLALSRAFAGFETEVEALGIQLAAGTKVCLATHDEAPWDAAEAVEDYRVRLRDSIHSLGLLPQGEADLLAVCFDDEGLRRDVLAGFRLS